MVRNKKRQFSKEETQISNKQMKLNFTESECKSNVTKFAGVYSGFFED
jgi:hypothetical protein